MENTNVQRWAEAKRISLQTGEKDEQVFERLGGEALPKLVKP